MRKRTARRAAEREVVKLVRDRVRLNALDEGGSPDRPIAVPSASVVEVRALEAVCPACDFGGSPMGYRIESHEAVQDQRVLTLACKSCGLKRVLYFRLAARALN
jgi:hypothetical protein